MRSQGYFCSRPQKVCSHTEDLEGRAGGRERVGQCISLGLAGSGCFSPLQRRA